MTNPPDPRRIKALSLREHAREARSNGRLWDADISEAQAGNLEWEVGYEEYLAGEAAGLEAEVDPGGRMQMSDESADAAFDSRRARGEEPY